MLDVDISASHEFKKDYLDFEKIKEICEYVVKNEKKENFYNKSLYISIYLTDNENIRIINKEYRNIDKETDVISFAYNETENIGEVEVIGDIVISLEKVETQALDYNHSNSREFNYILIHGLLHILGYDHIDENDKIEMRKKEEAYLTYFNYLR